MKKQLLLAVALSCVYASAQTVNPNQIRPGTNGQSLQTVGGQTAWANGGGGSFPSGTAGQYLGYAATGTTVAPLSMQKDCALDNAGSITCTKTNGNPFAASATTDTTNASNITSGTIPVARLPLGTNSTRGAVQCDGTTTTCASGIISAVGGGGGGAAFPGTNGIVFNTSTTASRNGTANDIMGVLGNPPGLVVSGDSIGASTGASNISLGFAYLLRQQIGGKYLNYSYPGDQCLEVSNTAYSTVNPTTGGSSFMQECGTNDVTQYNSSANLQTTFKRIVTGNLLWAALPVASKTFAQSCTSTGFSADPAYLAGLAAVSTTSGSTLSCTVTTGPNGNIAVGYLVLNAGGGTFTIKVDGTLQSDPFASGTTFYAQGDGGANITTQLGTTQGFVGAVFTGFSASSTHTVLFTVTSSTSASNPVEVAFAAGMPASSASNPNVIVVSPNHQNNANDTLSGTYAGYESAIVTTLTGYGLNATYADTRAALGTNYGSYYADAIHPNDAGHALMDTTITAAVPTLVTNAPANLANGPSDIFPPNGAVPLNPSQFFNTNPYRLNLTTEWNPGILYLKNRGQLAFAGFQNGIGTYMAGSLGTIPVVLCQINIPQPANQTYVSSPSMMFCPMGIAANGVSFMGSDGSGLGGFAAYYGDTYTNGFTNGAVTGSGDHFINGVNNYVSPSQKATSSANYPSTPLWHRAGVWTGTTPAWFNMSWNAVPETGANPNTYFTPSVQDDTGGVILWGIDLSSSKLPLTLPNFTTDPTSPRVGAIWINTTSNQLKWNDGAAVDTAPSLNAANQFGNATQTFGLTGSGETQISNTGLKTIDTSLATTFTVDSATGDTTSAGTITAASFAASGAGPSQVALTYNATPIVPGSGTTAVYGVNASGQAVASEAGGAAARFCTASNGVCSGGIANTTVTLPTSSIAANTCTTPATATMTGVATTSVFATAFATNPNAVTGWGSSGGLTFTAWPTSNTLNWSVCNQTAGSITPGAMTLNVGAR